MRVSLLVTGRMYHAAADLPGELELSEGATLSQLLTLVNERLESPLPDSCLIAVSGEHLGTAAQHEDRSLKDGDEVDLISPVAGG